MVPVTFAAAEGLSKAYAGVQALREVSLDLEAGEVHAIVGENGAGKSTLIRILTGAVQPDAGTLAIDGTRVDAPRPAGRAPSAGSPSSTSSPRCSRISASRRTCRWRLDGARGSSGSTGRQRRRDARWLLEAAGDCHRSGWLGRHAVDRRAADGRDRARARAHEARIVIMDEPTASLPVHDVDG